MSIKLNQYFNGNIKSLGFELEETCYTTGVLLEGTYTIDTEQEERITVTVGAFKIKPAGQRWCSVRAGDTIVIPARSSFEAKVEKPASYICMYM